MSQISDCTEYCSFSPLPRTSSSHTTDFQSDLRMTYCAVVIADILKDVSAFDRSSCISFMNQCRVRSPGVYLLTTRPGKELMRLALV